MDQSVFTGFPKGAVQATGVGTVLYAKVIAFNTKKYTREIGPRSWADVWDVAKFPGPRIIDAGNYVIPPIEYVLLAYGVAPENLYPLDFERAYAAFSRIKPNVFKWATSAALETEALVSGEGVIGPAQQGRIEQAKQQGAPVDYVWNQALIEHSYCGILRGAKNVENAQKFIEFASRADSQAAYAKLFVIGPLNKKAFDLIPLDRAKVLPTYLENVAKAIWRNAAWWAKKDASGRTNQAINSALWNAWSLQK
ncbi:extracellular solute-binding protein [Bradyrhizobium sp. BR 1432]|uniref:extracellular solute-binding protein n=1 Tax=Bradyrhizobium sp. BR 1432 TaxID=3447966 RepID=UPI003EE7A1F9